MTRWQRFASGRSSPSHLNTSQRPECFIPKEFDKQDIRRNHLNTNRMELLPHDNDKIFYRISGRLLLEIQKWQFLQQDFVFEFRQQLLKELAFQFVRILNKHFSCGIDGMYHSNPNHAQYVLLNRRYCTYTHSIDESHVP